MKILHLGPIIFHSDDNPSSKKSVSKIGGLSNSIVKLALGQSENNNKVAVVTTRETDEPKDIGIDFLSIGKRSLRYIIFNDPFDEISKKFFIPDILHTHDIFELKSLPLIFYAYRRGIKVYVSPRGTLSPVALNRKKIKKKIFINCLFQMFLSKIEAFVALNNGEKEHILKTFRKKKIVIISNGCDSNDVFYQRFRSNYENKKEIDEINIGFMGRFEIYIKGLDILLHSLREFQKENDPKKIRITLMGDHVSKEFDSKLFIDEARKSLTDPSMLTIIGPKYDEEKWHEISKFDIFIHPSRTEGMPNGVLEAISMGIPCAVSVFTNMADIIKDANCGWIIDTEIDSLANDLLSFSKMDKSLMIQKGRSGKFFAEEKLSWREISKSLYF
jgi:glycosyltransferase involved in cell wall biosynthesis